MASIEERLMTALDGITEVIVPNLFQGTDSEYIVFNYDEYPDCFGDDEETETRCYVQVHLVCPHGQNPNATKKAIKQAIKGMGGTAPTVVNANDSDCQHYVFEFYLLADHEEDD